MRLRVRQGSELLTEKASPKMCSAHAALSITAHHAYGSLISVLCLKQLFPPTESTGGRIRANFNNFHQAQSIVRPFIEVNTVWPVAFIFQISNSRTAEHPGEPAIGARPFLIILFSIKVTDNSCPSVQRLRKESSACHLNMGICRGEEAKLSLR